jgi:hypothetical protein
VITTGRWLPTVAAAAIAVSACAGAASGADGRHSASESRRSVAITFWHLYSSLGSSVITSGGDGRFNQCGNPAADSVIYAVHMIIAPRNRGSAEEEFLAAIVGRLKRAGWRLLPTGGAYQVTVGSGVQIAVGPSRLDGARTAASVTVTGRCTDAGPAAAPIVTAYQDTTDQYRAVQAAASPVPTGFPGH